MWKKNNKSYEIYRNILNNIISMKIEKWITKGMEI
jgi:hypothetical protein